MSILNIQPHKVSKDLRGYSVLFYGDPKSGKTSTAVQFPKHLLLAFEKGYAAIPGAMAKPINRWGEFVEVMRELRNEATKEHFETVIVDTADIAYELCESYICNREGVDSIGDIGYGKGYSMVAEEFDSKMREITQLGYGLVLISHSIDKTFTDENGNEFNQIVPTLPKKANTIVSRMCDIIGYSRSVETEGGNLETRLFMRGTPRYVAGSRFRDIPSQGYQFPQSIRFTYQNLVDTISEAVENLEKFYGEEFVTDEVGDHNLDTSHKTRDLEEVLEEFNQVAGSLLEQDEEYYAPRIKMAVEEVFGRGQKISDAEIDQVDLAELALSGVKQLQK